MPTTSRSFNDSSDRSQHRGVLPPPVTANVAVAQALRGRASGYARAAAATPGRGTPPPPPRPSRAYPPRPAAAMGRKVARAAEADRPPTESEQGQYRISELPADVVAPVSIAQGVNGARGAGLRTQAMQVVEIASAIAGAAMTRVLDNTGDVSWELDQMPRDSVHPDGASSTPSTESWQRRTITLPGPRVENGLTQETFADCEVNFSYNNASIGFVEVSTLRAEDAWGWGLVVRENLSQDPNTYTDSSGKRFAALKLRFHYRFDHSPLQDVIAIGDLTVYGNGSHGWSFRWTQP